MSAANNIRNDSTKQVLSRQVPNFKINEYKKKSSQYAVCVFVINEGDKVRRQLRDMTKLTDQVDVIVADGGSTDGSLDDGFLKSCSARTLLTKTGPGKLSAQMRMAFAYCLDEGYEGVIVVDGNGKDDISAIPDFVKLLEKGYDHIQGSRFIKGGNAINTPIERLIAVRLIHAPMLSLASHHRHTDTTNGFRAYSARLLRDEDLNIFRDVFSTYELHYYLAVESARSKKFNLTETPVTRRYPKKGKTPTKISPIKGNLQVLKILSKASLRQYRP